MDKSGSLAQESDFWSVEGESLSEENSRRAFGLRGTLEVKTPNLASTNIQIPFYIPTSFVTHIPVVFSIAWSPGGHHKDKCHFKKQFFFKI